MSNKTGLLSSLILSIGIIIGCWILAAKPEVAAVTETGTAQESILLDTKETSALLGITEKELKSVIAEEKRVLNTTGSYEGTRLSFIVIEGKQYFEKTNLLLWAQESTKLYKEY